MSPSTRSSVHSQNPNNYSHPSAYNNNNEDSIKRNTRSSSTESHLQSQVPPQHLEKQPPFSTSALAIRVPSISPPPSSESASSDRETLYLERTRLLNRLRFGLGIPILGASIPVIVCQALALKFYNDTHLPASFNLPLWPDDVDLRPVFTTLVAGGFVTASYVAYMLVALVPSVSDLTPRHYIHLQIHPPSHHPTPLLTPTNSLTHEPAYSPSSSPLSPPLPSPSRPWP